MTALSSWSDQLTIYNGTTPVTSGVTYSVASQTNCTVAISSTGLITCSAITADSASATVQGVYAGVTAQKTVTFAKARQGVAGSGFSPIFVTLQSTANVFKYDGTGTASPSGQSVTFNVSRQNSSASVTWALTDIAGTARTPLSTYLTVAADSLSATMSEAQFASARNGTAGVHVTISMTDGSTFTDSTSVVKVADGAAGSSGSNTAPVWLYQRASSTPSAPTGATTSYSFTTGLLSVTTGSLGSWTQSIPASSGSVPLYATLAIATGTGTSATILGSSWATPVLYVQDGAGGTPGTPGSAGTNAATVFLYQRAATAPTVPSGTTSYSFTNGILSLVTGSMNGWVQSVPTTNGNPCWIITAPALSTTSTDTIGTAEWDTPSILAQDGAGGSPGANSATVHLFQRAASTPTLPSSTLTYTFSSGALAGTLGSWSTSVPAANGQPLYTTTALASSNTATVSIPAASWVAATILAQDGGTGPAGPTIGLTESAGVFYFVDGVAATPTASITFTATRQNTSETVNFTTTPTVTLTGSGLTRSLAITDFGTNTSVVITATGATSGASASVTVNRSDASSGTDSILTDSDFRGSYMCVTTDTILPSHDRAGDVKVGDRLVIGNPVTFRQRLGRVSFAEPETQECVRITTESGIELDCSTSAPIATEGGECVEARHLLGCRVPVIDGTSKHCELVVGVEPIGPQPIMQITCEDDLFLAGREQSRYLYHHNIKQFWSGDGRFDLLP